MDVLKLLHMPGLIDVVLVMELELNRALKK
jgi:hypothetical protein